METKVFNPTISIIIPCGNMASGLIRSLRSVERQTLPMEEMELILVDDVSTDASIAIMTDFAERHPDNVTVIEHKLKAGMGSAANLALTYAGGEYVTFLQGGDILYDNACERMIALAKKNDLDILQTIYDKVDLDGNESRVEGSAMYGLFDLSDPELRKELLIRDIMTLDCRSKLFRRDLLVRVRSSFAEGVGYAEPKFVYPLLLNAGRVGTADLLTHCVCERELSSEGDIWRRNLEWLERPKFELQLLYWLKQRPELFLAFKDEILYHFFRCFYLEPIYITASTDAPITGYDYEWMRLTAHAELADAGDNPYMNGGDLAILIRNLGHSFLEDDVSLADYLESIRLTFESVFGV